MKLVKILAAVVIGYVGVVVAFESLIGVLQPQAGNVLIITTFDAAGQSNDRVLAHLETDGKIYVAANHWPRAWYRQALENPHVEVAIDGDRGAYRAMSPTAAESQRVHQENHPGIGFRILTGFPPRLFLRLDPRTM